MFHHLLGPTDGLHSPFNWVVADAAAKAALVIVDGDRYKALWQVDISTIYILTSTSPVTWTAVSGGSSGGGGSTPNIAFSAILSGTNQNTVPGFNKVLFNLEEYDSGLFDQPNSKAIIATAGKYLFTVGVGFTGLTAGTNNLATLYKNGVEYRRGSQLGSSVYGIAMTAEINCAVGDIIEGYMFSGSAATVVANGVQTYFQGRYVGA